MKRIQLKHMRGQMRMRGGKRPIGGSTKPIKSLCDTVFKCTCEEKCAADCLVMAWLPPAYGACVGTCALVDCDKGVDSSDTF